MAILFGKYSTAALFKDEDDDDDDNRAAGGGTALVVEDWWSCSKIPAINPLHTVVYMVHGHHAMYMGTGDNHETGFYEHLAMYRTFEEGGGVAGGTNSDNSMLGLSGQQYGRLPICNDYCSYTRYRPIPAACSSTVTT